MIAVILSGTGRSLENLIYNRFKDKIAWVGTHRSSADCKGMLIAKEAGLTCHVFDDSAGVFDEARKGNIELIVMAGYIQKLIIPDDYTNKVINIHPSLLPAFGGKGMYGMNVHKAVIESGVKVSGCTVHYANNEYDQGPIIYQMVVYIAGTDTASDLAAKVFQEEKWVLPWAINLHLADKLKVVGNRVSWV